MNTPNALRYLTHINLSGNEIQSVVLQNLDSHPTEMVKAGRIYYNSIDNKPYYHNGTGWVELGGGGEVGATYTLTVVPNAEGAADNLAKIVLTGSDGTTNEITFTADNNGKITFTDGTNTDTISIIDIATDMDDTGKIPTVDVIKTYIENNIIDADIMEFRGGVSSTTPLPSDATHGNVYIVAEDGTYDGKQAVIGDMFIANKPDDDSTLTWVYVPAGDNHVYSTKNTALTPNNGLCTWSVTSFALRAVTGITVKDISTGEVVIPQITYTQTDNTAFNVNIVSASTIPENTYEILYTT